MAELISEGIARNAGELKLLGMAENADEFVDRADAAKLGYREFLELVLESEVGVLDGLATCSASSPIFCARICWSVMRSAICRSSAPTPNRFFQLISRRYMRSSMIVTSNKRVSAWAELFGDEVLAAAILDRLLHDAEILTINGPSWRLRGRGDPLDGGQAD